MSINDNVANLGSGRSRTLGEAQEPLPDLLAEVVLDLAHVVQDLHAVSEPDLSAESTPKGGWCQMKQANIFFLLFTENLPKSYPMRAKKGEKNLIKISQIFRVFSDAFSQFFRKYLII